MTIRVYVLLLLAIAQASCSGGKQGEETEESAGEQSGEQVSLPAFDADSAFQYVAEQVSFGPRVPNTRAHEACGDYLAAKLESWCDTVYVQEFTAEAWDGTLLKLKNIIGSFNPGEKSRRFIAAHWDSRPYADHDPDSAFHMEPIDGANDGASGVGVILELARIMHEKPPSGGVDLVLFDGEDYGEPQWVESEDHTNWALGSAYWSKNPMPRTYRANFGILLDMVGVPEPEFSMEGTSMYFAPDIMKRVWDKAAAMGYGKYFIREETAPVVDDHLMVNQHTGIPCINIIHREDKGSGFFEHWHTREDNLENVDTRSLGMVGNVVVAVIYEGL